MRTIINLNKSWRFIKENVGLPDKLPTCLLYTSDAADEQ